MVYLTIWIKIFSLGRGSEYAPNLAKIYLFNAF